MMTMQSPTQILAQPTAELPTYDANDLTKGGGQAQIVYEDKTYTLRITRAGKLILTK